MNPDIWSRRRLHEGAIDLLTVPKKSSHRFKSDNSGETRGVVHAQWREAVTRRRRSRLKWIAVAAAITALAAMPNWQIALRSVHAPAGRVATLSYDASEPVTRRSEAIKAPLLRREIAMYADDQLRTGNHDLLMMLSSGITLRIAPHSEVRIASASALSLLSGSLYVGSASHTAHLTVNTPFGTVAHLGMPYSAQLTNERLNVQVRDGAVNILGPTPNRVYLNGRLLH